MKYPIFVEYGHSTVKIENDDTYVDIANDEWDNGIVRKKKANNVVDLMIKRGNKINEATFNNAYQNALTKLKEMLL